MARERAAKKEKPVKEKKAKKDGPKRAKSAYLFFAQEIRPQVKADHPDLSFGDTTKEIANQWNALSTAEKKPYVDMQKEDQKRYEAEKAAA